MTRLKIFSIINTLLNGIEGLLAFWGAALFLILCTGFTGLGDSIGSGNNDFERSLYNLTGVFGVLAGIMMFLVAIILVLLFVFYIVPFIVGFVTLIRSKKKLLISNLKSASSFRTHGIVATVFNGITFAITLVVMGMYVSDNGRFLDFIIALFITGGILALSIMQIIFANKEMKN